MNDVNNPDALNAAAAPVVAAHASPEGLQGHGDSVTGQAGQKSAKGKPERPVGRSGGGGNGHKHPAAHETDENDKDDADEGEDEGEAEDADAGEGEGDPLQALDRLPPPAPKLWEAPSEAFVAAQQLNTKGPYGPLELTVVVGNGRFPKSFDVKGDGTGADSIVEVEAPKFPSSGWFLRWRLSRATPMADLARGITGLPGDHAVMLGQLAGTAPARLLTTIGRWDALSTVERGGAAEDTEAWMASAGPLTRSKQCFPGFRPGPAVLGIDVDVKDLPSWLQDKIRQEAGFSAVMSKFVPGFDKAGMVVRRSVSSGIINTKTGTKKPASGEHVYVGVQDGGDVARFLKALFERLLLAGYGFVVITADGKVLPRTIFDQAASGDPCRLLFEALADLKHPDLAHDPKARQCSVQEGLLLDTSLVQDLTVDEQAQVGTIAETLREACAGEALERRRAHYAPQIAARQKRVGGTREDAERQVFAAVAAGRLSLDGMYALARSGAVSGWEILADPERFLGKVGPDPVEPGYKGGGNKVKLYRRSPQPNSGIWRGGVLFHSKAHSGINRVLAYDATDIVVLVGQMAGTCAARVARLRTVYETLYAAIDTEQAAEVLRMARVPSAAVLAFGDPDELAAAGLLKLLEASDWKPLARLHAAWGGFFDLALAEARAHADGVAAAGFECGVAWDTVAEQIAAALQTLQNEPPASDRVGDGVWDDSDGDSGGLLPAERKQVWDAGVRAVRQALAGVTQDPGLLDRLTRLCMRNDPATGQAFDQALDELANTLKVGKMRVKTTRRQALTAGAKARAQATRLLAARGRTVIELDPDGFDGNCDNVRSMLAGADPPVVFRLGDVLVLAIENTDLSTQLPWAKNVAEGAATLPVTVALVREAMARVAVFRDPESDKAVTPPQDIAQTVAASAIKVNAPKITGLLPCPVLRDDGSIAWAQGYDRETGAYVMVDMSRLQRRVPEGATQADAQAAMADLLAPFDEMPFDPVVGKSVLAAHVLTLLVRHLVPLSPAFIFVSPTARSGKGLAASSASRIVLGREPTLTPALAGSRKGDDAEEMRKRLLALLCNGRTDVIIDNVPRGSVFGSPAIDALLTAPVWTDRLLQTSQVATVPNRLVLAVTGNNIRLWGDLGARVMAAQLDHKVASPETKAFRIANLRQHLYAERETLLAAVLTILSAHLRLNQPLSGGCTSAPFIGSFEEWCRVVAAAVEWCGLENPLASTAWARGRLDAGQEDTERLEGLLVAIHACPGLGDELFQVSDLLDAAEKLTVVDGKADKEKAAQQVRETAARQVLRERLQIYVRLSDERGRGTTLGRALKAQEGRVTAGGWTLEPCGHNQGVRRYRVVAPKGTV
jgi:hypothetical protein